MCYYEQTLYACTDWKWGNMKERCPRQHRMGETCGVKLVHSDHLHKIDQLCRVCKDLDIKTRKLAKEKDNIARWRKEGKKFSASIEKAENEVDRLMEAIESLEGARAVSKNGLQRKRQDVMHTGGSCGHPLHMFVDDGQIAIRTRMQHIMFSR